MTGTGIPATNPRCEGLTELANLICDVFDAAGVTYQIKVIQSPPSC